jgi:hypothetical protein
MAITTASPLMASAWNAYLTPLLKKHEKGQAVVYEDLVASWQAVETILKQQESAPDFNTVVSERVIFGERQK